MYNRTYCISASLWQHGLAVYVDVPNQDAGKDGLFPYRKTVILWQNHIFLSKQKRYSGDLGDKQKLKYGSRSFPRKISSTMYRIHEESNKWFIANAFKNQPNI